MQCVDAVVCVLNCLYLRVRLPLASYSDSTTVWCPALITNTWVVQRMPNKTITWMDTNTFDLKKALVCWFRSPCEFEFEDRSRGF